MTRLFVLCFALAVPLSCGNDLPGPHPQVQDVDALYWALVLDQHAITMSITPPYDTVRLTATPRTVTGAVLTGVPAVTYQSTDLARVRVSAEGLVQAVKAEVGTLVPVVATLTVGHLTHVDTAFVEVTAATTPPTLASFALQAEGDSARWEANTLDGLLYGPALVTAVGLDGLGQPIPGLLVEFRSSNPDVATINPRFGDVQGITPGQVTLSASTTFYGVTKTATLPFTITAPLIAQIDLARPYLGAHSWVFSPQEVTIEVGGIVVWGISPNFLRTGLYDGQSHQVDVVFADPTNVAVDEPFCVASGLPVCDPGDIPAFGDTTSDNFGNFFLNLRSRQFHMVGTYPYHSGLLNSTGTIHVVETPRPAPAPRRARQE